MNHIVLIIMLIILFMYLLIDRYILGKIKNERAKILKDVSIEKINAIASYEEKLNKN